MLRISIKVPLNQCRLNYRQSMHSAILNAWIKAGADRDSVYGESAKPWTFAILGPMRGQTQNAEEVVISTANENLSKILQKFDPADVTTFSSESESISLAGGKIFAQNDPFLPGQKSFYADFASPFVVSERALKGEKKRMINDFAKLDLSSAFSRNLSRRQDQPVEITVLADRLAIASSKTSIRVVPIRRAAGRTIYFSAWSFPVEIRGETEALRSAWYGGVGEKTKYGFGCMKSVL